MLVSEDFFNQLALSLEKTIPGLEIEFTRIGPDFDIRIVHPDYDFKTSFMLRVADMANPAPGYHQDLIHRITLEVKDVYRKYAKEADEKPMAGFWDKFFRAANKNNHKDQ